MGQKQSAPVIAPTRALSDRSECQVNDVQLNMARNDLAQKDQKWEQCYPEEAIQRRIRTLRDEANKYSKERREEQRQANDAFQRKLDSVKKMSKITQQLIINLNQKEDELKKLTSNRENLEQYERRERRAFLDNSPQDGIGGAPGVRTSDDRALLTFWITYGVTIILASIFILDVYGTKLGTVDIKSKIQIIVAILLIAYFIAYYMISYYG